MDEANVPSSTSKVKRRNPGAPAAPPGSVIVSVNRTKPSTSAPYDATTASDVALADAPIRSPLVSKAAVAVALPTVVPVIRGLGGTELVALNVLDSNTGAPSLVSGPLTTSVLLPGRMPPNPE